MQKKGPPVALLVGGGCGLVAVLGVILLVVLLVTSRGSASDDDDEDRRSSSSSKSKSDEDDDDVDDAMDGAVYKRIPSTNVEVPVPPGWRESRKSLYSFATAGDGKAMIAFTTVSSLGEWAGRIQHANRVFSITGCKMQAAKRVRLGPHKLRSRLKEGTCTFNGVRAQVATVLVESGRRAHPLIIYAVDNTASRRTTVRAQQTILRIRRR